MALCLINYRDNFTFIFKDEGPVASSVRFNLLMELLMCHPVFLIPHGP